MGNDSVKCWGANSAGQLGNNTTTNSSMPVDVIGLNGIKALRSSAGLYSCAIMSDETVKCWGTQYSQNSLQPAVLNGLNGIKSLSLGEYHGCALTNSGTVKCWGLNSGGQLGNNSFVDSANPVDVLGLIGVKFIGSGFASSCAGIVGGTKCWGGNNRGVLGNNTTDKASVPLDVMTSTVFSSVEVGLSHACGISAADSTIKCWGNNVAGQAGTGAAGQDILLPVDIFDPRT